MPTRFFPFCTKYTVHKHLLKHLFKPNITWLGVGGTGVVSFLQPLGTSVLFGRNCAKITTNVLPNVSYEPNGS